MTQATIDFLRLQQAVEALGLTLMANPDASMLAVTYKDVRISLSAGVAEHALVVTGYPSHFLPLDEREKVFAWCADFARRNRWATPKPFYDGHVQEPKGIGAAVVVTILTPAGASDAQLKSWAGHAITQAAAAVGDYEALVASEPRD